VVGGDPGQLLDRGVQLALALAGAAQVRGGRPEGGHRQGAERDPVGDVHGALLQQ
jgi:hypothetical protein